MAPNYLLSTVLNVLMLLEPLAILGGRCCLLSRFTKEETGVCSSVAKTKKDGGKFAAPSPYWQRGKRSTQVSLLLRCLHCLLSEGRSFLLMV